MLSCPLWAWFSDFCMAGLYPVTPRGPRTVIPHSPHGHPHPSPLPCGSAPDVAESQDRSKGDACPGDTQNFHDFTWQLAFPSSPGSLEPSQVPRGSWLTGSQAWGSPLLLQHPLTPAEFPATALPSQRPKCWRLQGESSRTCPCGLPLSLIYSWVPVSLTVLVATAGAPDSGSSL